MFFESAELLKQHIESQHKDQKVVFTNGCFDILHIGHVRYLQEARACGEFLIVGVNSDRSVKQLKGPERPLQTEKERAQILAALQAVDATVIFDEETPLNLITQLNPNVLVKGGDWAIDQIVGSDHVLKMGGEVKSLQFVQGRSTTNLVEKIKTENQP